MKMRVKGGLIAAVAGIALAIGGAAPAQAVSGSYSCANTFTGGAVVDTDWAGHYVEWHPTNQDLANPPKTLLRNGTIFYVGHYQKAGRFKTFTANVQSAYGTCRQ